MRTLWSHKNAARDVCRRIPLKTRGKLYVSPMPYGPYDTGNAILRRYRKKGINQVVVLAMQEEIERKGRKDLFNLYAKAKMEITHFPFPDLTAPILKDMDGLIQGIVQDLETRNVAIHCNAGVGRTGVITGCVIAQHLHYSGEEALAYLQEQVLLDMTDEQKRFVTRWTHDKHTASQLVP